MRVVSHSVMGVEDGHRLLRGCRWCGLVAEGCADAGAERVHVDPGGVDLAAGGQCPLLVAAARSGPKEQHCPAAEGVAGTAAANVANVTTSGRTGRSPTTFGNFRLRVTETPSDTITATVSDSQTATKTTTTKTFSTSPDASTSTTAPPLFGRRRCRVRVRINAQRVQPEEGRRAGVLPRGSTSRRMKARAEGGIKGRPASCCVEAAGVQRTLVYGSAVRQAKRR